MTMMRVVGECFFWYRLTRVFPDKFHRAVKRLCVCVCNGLRVRIKFMGQYGRPPLATAWLLVLLFTQTHKLAMVGIVNYLCRLAKEEDLVLMQETSLSDATAHSLTDSIDGFLVMHSSAMEQKLSEGIH